MPASSSSWGRHGSVWGATRGPRPLNGGWASGSTKVRPKAAERRRSRSRCVPCNTVHRGVAQGRWWAQVMLVAAGRNRCWGRHGCVSELMVASQGAHGAVATCRSLLLRRTGRISQTGVLGMPGAPRVRRLVNPPPRPKNNSLAIPTSGPAFPQATETKNLVLHDLIARRAEDARAVVTWCPRAPHTEAIRRMCNLINRKAYALASVVVRLPLEPHS